MTAFDGTHESVQLSSILEDPAPDLSGAPTAFLDYLPSSRSDPPRIDLRVRIVNQTGRELMITANPYYGMTYTLSDDEGWPVQTATPPHPAKIDAPSDAGRQERMRYLRLISAHMDGAVLDLEGALSRPDFALAPGATLAYELAVESMADRDDEELVGPLTAGTYELGLLLPLSFAAAGANQDVILTSEEVEMTLDV